MIDPKTVTNYNRNESELQEWLLYCICVAGKRSNVETRKLNSWLDDLNFRLEGIRTADQIDQILDTPFNFIREQLKSNELASQLKKHRISPYQSRYNSFTDVVRLLPDDLSKVTVDELQAVRGIGTKTSRFFLTHSREDFDEPVLDTHILRFLRDMGHNVPSVTPQSPKKYAQVAEVFKYYARSANKTVAELDLEVWKSFSKSVTDHIAEYSST